eukprot:5348785-Pyramimonas_sp.AAC.1
MFARVRPTLYSASWPHKELRQKPQWRCSHASAHPSTAPRGPIGSSNEGPSGEVRMRPPHTAQRSVAQ